MGRIATHLTHAHIRQKFHGRWTDCKYNNKPAGWSEREEDWKAHLLTVCSTHRTWGSFALASCICPAPELSCSCALHFLVAYCPIWNEIQVFFCHSHKVLRVGHRPQEKLGSLGGHSLFASISASVPAIPSAWDLSPRALLDLLFIAFSCLRLRTSWEKCQFFLFPIHHFFPSPISSHSLITSWMVFLPYVYLLPSWSNLSLSPLDS